MEEGAATKRRRAEGLKSLLDDFTTAAPYSFSWQMNVESPCGITNLLGMDKKPSAPLEFVSRF